MWGPYSPALKHNKEKALHETYRCLAEKKMEQRKCLHVTCCSYLTSSSFSIMVYCNRDSLKRSEKNSLKQKWFVPSAPALTRPAIKLLHLTSHYQSILNTVVGDTHSYIKTTINPLPPVLYLDLCN